MSQKISMAVEKNIFNNIDVEDIIGIAKNKCDLSNNPCFLIFKFNNIGNWFLCKIII